MMAPLMSSSIAAVPAMLLPLFTFFFPSSRLKPEAEPRPTISPIAIHMVVSGNETLVEAFPSLPTP